MQIGLRCLKSNYNLKPRLDGNDKHVYLLCIAQTKLNVAQRHVLFLALVSHLPLYISVVSHCYTLLAQTLKHADRAVMNGSKLRNRALLPCCAQSSHDSDHPSCSGVLQQKNKTKKLPPRQFFPYRYEMSNALDTQERNTLNIFCTCVCKHNR